MAANRKLQQDIERTLKRVTEGIAEFNDIWEKVHSAPNENLKQKLEADLKKEIKKLQRYRDQIKTWAGNNDIKNKKPLLDARKDIETEMERFKVLEKESKTKAYSKEGLNRDNRTKKDPEKDPKYPTYQWIDKMRAKLKAQLTGFEKSVDGFKANKKKGQDGQFKEMQHWIDRHTAHLDKLKLIKRWLKAEFVEEKQVKEVQDDVNFYIEHNQDSDFFEDEGLYDALNDTAAAAEEEKGEAPELSEDEEEEGSPTGSDVEDEGDAEDEDDEREKAAAAAKKKKEQAEKEKKDKEAAQAASTAAAKAPAKAPAKTPAVPAVSVPATAGKGVKTDGKDAGSPNVPPTDSKSKAKTTAAEKPSTTAAPAKTASAAPKKGTSPLVTGTPGPTPTAAQMVAGKTGAATATTAAGKTTPKLGPVASPPEPKEAPKAATRTGETMAQIIKGKQEDAKPKQPATRTPAQLAAQQQAMNAQAQTQAAIQAKEREAQQRLEQEKAAATESSTPSTSTTPAAGGSSKSNLGTLTPTATGTASEGKSKGDASASTPAVTMPASAKEAAGSSAAGAAKGSGTAPSKKKPSVGKETKSPAIGATEAPSTGLAGALGQGQNASPTPSPRGMYRNLDGVSNIDPESLAVLNQLEPSLRNLPDPFDTDKPKQYLPRNPCRTPAYFPSAPAAVFDDPAIFEKFGTDTLFFVFYFQQGTPHQYLAARELKKQSWRYHKNFLTWFQRHEDPKLTTDEFEQGTYVYFDYDSGWCQRIKSDFTFEYRHLEDELSVPMTQGM